MKLITRLPILSLESSEIKRLPACEIRRRLECADMTPELPIQLTLDEAWEKDRFSTRYILYYEKNLNEDIKEGQYRNRFRLVAVHGQNSNLELVLDEGIACPMDYDGYTRRENAHIRVKARSRKLGGINFMLPLENIEFFVEKKK